MSRSLKIALIASLLANLTIVYVAYKALEYRSHINFFLDKYNAVVEEFSGRSQFAEQNRRLVSDTIVPGRLVIFGTQLAANWPDSLLSSNFEVINRGLSAQRAAGLLLRFRQDVVALGPQYVLIEVSSYNLREQWSIEEILDYAKSMAELARQNGIEPILTTMVPLLDDVGQPENYSVSDSLAKYNAELVKFATTHNFKLLDMNELVSNEAGNLRSDYSSGPIDLNEAGYRAVTEGLREILN